MQPYLFPYIGYFQLVYSVNKFVFYDDVQFKKRGWINRNYILEKGERKFMLTLALEGGSSTKMINEIRQKDTSGKILKTIEQNYKKAPYFELAFPLIRSILSFTKEKQLISELAILSIKSVAGYIGLKTEFVKSSEKYPETAGIGRIERPMIICKKENADVIINPIGGEQIYNKEDFRQRGVELCFLKANHIQYRQFNKKFVPNLSIIDVIMFNSPNQTNEFLKEFVLI